MRAAPESWLGGAGRLLGQILRWAMSERSALLSYRVYFYDKGQRFKGAAVVQASGDDEAVRAGSILAEAYSDQHHGIEIWQRNRLIASFDGDATLTAYETLEVELQERLCEWEGLLMDGKAELQRSRKLRDRMKELLELRRSRAIRGRATSTDASSI